MQSRQALIKNLLAVSLLSLMNIFLFEHEYKERNSSHLEEMKKASKL